MALVWTSTAGYCVLHHRTPFSLKRDACIAEKSLGGVILLDKTDIKGSCGPAGGDEAQEFTPRCSCLGSLFS